MTLFLENPVDTFTAWRGDKIGGISHPTNIEKLWSPNDLSAIGLFLPEDADQVPDGSRIVSRSVHRVYGVVKFVNLIEVIPDPTQQEIDAELDDLVRSIDSGKSLLRALAVKQFQLEKALINGSLTASEFKADIRQIITNF